MENQDRLRAETRAHVLKALAHPTRIYIVDVIDREGPHSVQRLTELVGADTSTVSRHLSILKNAGVLRDRKEGTTVYYSLSCACIGDFMTGLEGLLRAKHMHEQEAYAATLSSADAG